MQKRLRQGRAGFTLIELLVVIAIIGILATIVSFITFSLRNHARDLIVSFQLQQLKRGIRLLALETGRLPGGCVLTSIYDAELPMNDPSAGLTEKPTVGASTGSCVWSQGAVDLWNGPYFTKSIDPWGNPYWYDADYYPRRDCPSNDPYPGDPVYPALVSTGPNGVGGVAPNWDYDCDDIFILLQNGEFTNI